MQYKTLDEIAFINPDSIKRNYPYTEIEYIDISSVGIGYLIETKKMLLSEASSRAKRLVIDKDTILSTVRPNRRSFLFIKKPKENIVVSTGFAVLRAKNGTDPRYLYYALTDQKFTDYLTLSAKGAAYPAVDTEIVQRGRIPYWPPEVQRKISLILSAYDDLIENNSRRIQILEEMAHRIYREWFIDFRFPGHKEIKLVDSEMGKIPEGWKVKAVECIAELHRGKSYASEDLLGNDSVPFFNLKNIQRNGGFRIDGTKSYSGKYKKEHIAKPGDILVAITDMTQERNVIARAARVPRLESDFGVFSMDLVRLEPKEGFSKCWFYGLLRYSLFSDKVKEYANGSNVLHLLPDRIKEYCSIVPPYAFQKQFEDIVGPIFSVVDCLIRKNDKLRITRDLLLPKLISGEIDVSEMDVVMENGVV